MEDARADLTGEIVDGRFRVEARLGGGGMGTVWRVQHVVSLQPFALKTLDPRAASQPEATRRFVREARAAAALRTRHVVKIVDAQMEYRHKGQPLPFLVMELLEGHTLLELLDARGRLRPGELGWLVGLLGRALDAAHRQGIVHRDLKPSNVFIAEDDERQPTIKLCDFGIAKLIDAGGEGSLETNTGALLGTPMYLAPEMLRGAGDAVPATDQWALGLLAFRALAGIEYFGHARGFSALVLAIANDPMRAPSQRGTSLPAAFDGWFLRSCARDPAARFPDVPAQVVALAAALGNPAPLPIAPFATAGPTGAVRPIEPGPDPALGPTQAAPRPPARSRARAVLLAASVAWALVALGAVSWLEGHPRAKSIVAATPDPAPSAVLAPPAAAPSAVPAPAAAAPAPAPPSAPAVAVAPRDEPAPAPTLPPAAPVPPAPAPTLAPAAPVPPPAVKEKRVHRRHVEPTVPAAPAAGAAVEPVRGKAKGASCQRSAECASGLCAAETCL